MNSKQIIIFIFIHIHYSFRQVYLCVELISASAHMRYILYSSWWSVDTLATAIQALTIEKDLVINL